MLKSKDENEIAFSSLQELMRRDAERGGVPQEPVKQPKKVPAVMAARHLRGKKGGEARATKLSAKKRKEIAKKAAQKRWGYDT